MCCELFRFSFYSSSSLFNTQYKEKAALGGSAVSLSLLRHSRPEERERREKYERDIQTVQLSLVVAQKAPSWRPEYNAATAPHVPVLSSSSVCVCYSFWKYIANAPFWWYVCVSCPCVVVVVCSFHPRTTHNIKWKCCAANLLFISLSLCAVALESSKLIWN